MRFVARDADGVGARGSGSGSKGRVALARPLAPFRRVPRRLGAYKGRVGLGRPLAPFRPVPRRLGAYKGRVGLACLLLLALLAGAGCRRQVEGANARVGQSEAPGLGAAEEAAGVGEEAALGGEEAVTVAEAAPPGLRIVNIKISPTTLGIRQATGFKGFRSGGPEALIELPFFGIDPRLGTYYLIVAVGNFGDAPVRNLKARADFLDAGGTRIWSETQPVTHFPTRLGLNPPSLPNAAEIQPPYDEDLVGFNLYYFPTNVGAFTFNVPDAAVSKQIKNWKLTFLVSTT